MLGEADDGLRRKLSSNTLTLGRLGATCGITKRPALLRQVSKLWMPLGKNIVIIGAELVGLELAEFLAERGRQVTVIDSASRAGKGLYLAGAPPTHCRPLDNLDRSSTSCHSRTN